MLQMACNVMSTRSIVFYEIVRKGLFIRFSRWKSRFLEDGGCGGKVTHDYFTMITSPHHEPSLYTSCLNFSFVSCLCLCSLSLTVWLCLDALNRLVRFQHKNQGNNMQQYGVSKNRSFDNVCNIYSTVQKAFKPVECCWCLGYYCSCRRETLVWF